MATSATSIVYIGVIKDVISKVHDEFVNNGPGESVLEELQGIWEMKMIQAGVVFGPIDRSSLPKQPAQGGPITPVHDLNVPYAGTEEYETPTAEILFPPTPLQTPIQTPLPGSTPLPVSTPLPGSTPLLGSTDNSMYNIPTGSSDYPTPVNDSGGNTEVKSGNGRPSSYMLPAPSPWMNQRQPLSVDVNVAYVEGREEADRGNSQQPLTQDFFMMSSGKRKREDIPSQYHNGGYNNIPQQDGARDSTSEIFQFEVRRGSVLPGRRDVVTSANRSSMKIPQLDGPIPDPYDDELSTPNVNIYNYQGVVNEDYNIVNTPAPNDLQASAPAVITQNDVGEDDDDDEPLNENDDEDLDDLDEGEELNTQHLVLAQFDKVTRAKSKWKCMLKDGIMHINNKDILFNKATGEFEF